MVNWVDQENEPESDVAPVPGPFSGAFVIMNVGEETQLSSEYQEGLVKAYASCMAAGHLLVHAFDRGIEPPPWFLGQVDGHNLPCLASVVGRKDFDFPALLEERKAEFGKMAEAVFSLEGSEFPGEPRFVIAGLCRIGGAAALMPPFEM
jgi:hypothetical protein